VIKELSADAAFAAVQVFTVDYADKATLRELKVTERSTLIAFKGKTERSRSSFETDPKAIRAIFESAVK
jgi:hypothetical protein